MTRITGSIRYAGWIIKRVNIMLSIEINIPIKSDVISPDIIRFKKNIEIQYPQFRFKSP